MVMSIMKMLFFLISTVSGSATSLIEAASDVFQGPYSKWEFVGCGLIYSLSCESQSLSLI